MNIFYLSYDPELAAEYHCDKHVVKMIVETAQLLSTAHHVLDGEDAIKGIYKKTHENHPCAIWVRESLYNYKWALTLLECLLKEYTKRYNKRHKTTDVFFLLKQFPANINWQTQFLTPPQCMPNKYKVENSAIAAYRAYYMGEKRDICTWKSPAKVPYWFY